MQASKLEVGPQSDLCVRSRSRKAPWHIEGKIAAYLRQQGFKDACVYLNARPCSGSDGCAHNLADLLPEPEDFDDVPVTEDPELNRVLVRAVLDGAEPARIMDLVNESGIAPPEPGRDDWKFAIVHDGEPETGTVIWS